MRLASLILALDIFRFICCGIELLVFMLRCLFTFTAYDNPKIAYSIMVCFVVSDAVWGTNSAVSPASVGELQHGGGALSVLLGVVVQRLGRLSRQPCDSPK